MNLLLIFLKILCIKKNTKKKQTYPKRQLFKIEKKVKKITLHLALLCSMSPNGHIKIPRNI